MKKILGTLICLVCITTYSHTINYENQVLRQWHIQESNRYVAGSFSVLKDNVVYIEDAQNNLVKVPLSKLSKADQQYVHQKVANINAINTTGVDQNRASSSIFFYAKFIGLMSLLIALLVLMVKKVERKKWSYVLPSILVGVGMTLFSFTKKMLTTTDPVLVNAAFQPFVPNVATSWDNTYFYVESKGIPSHTMMVGISNHGWQQQVPIPQCYVGSNHWSIPLNPVLAATPIPIDNVHFTRGAIAIAANGVPIFNYHTNTGVDSYTDGQLDNFGGHSGRGDDYHYHIAPLHLYTSGQTTTNLPCAYSFDGFPVYGSVEPDGSPMLALDANHGHLGSNGVYHYHGTSTAPYMIGNFVGQVTEDATYQLIPQPAAHPVRTENWTPLVGALITSLVPNGTNNGYNLTYTLNGVSGYGINYVWNGIVYTFTYITPTGSTTTNYNHGFAQCQIPLALEAFTIESQIKLYPNPASDLLHIDFGIPDLASKVQSFAIYGLKGDEVMRTTHFSSTIDIKNLAKGIYIVKIQLPNNLITKRLIIN